MTSLLAADVLLQRAHDELGVLENVRRRIQAAGVDEKMLPTLTDLRAFILLGPERHGEDLKRRLAPLLPSLVGKGLAEDGEPSAALARLYLAIAHLVGGILDTRQLFDLRLAEPPGSGGPLISCPPHATGAWGQRLQIQVQVSSDAQHLLVRPDPIFGVGEAIRHLNHPTDSTLWCELECDSGTVLFAALSPHGLSRHVLRIEVAE